MSISDKEFEKAQRAELANWEDFANSDDRIRYELVEHAEVIEPLRALAGTRRFEHALEVGVGPYSLGFLAVHFADALGRIQGLDPLPRLDPKVGDDVLQREIDQIRSRVDYVQARGESIPAEDSTFDLVCSINVIDHAQDPHKMVAEMGRVLKPGGWLVFGVNTLSWAGERKWHWLKSRNPDAWLYRAHPHTFQWARADQLLRFPGSRYVWCKRPSALMRLVGRGRMSFWILEKTSLQD